jgi:hypothetical protein
MIRSRIKAERGEEAEKDEREEIRGLVWSTSAQSAVQSTCESGQ